MDSKELDKIMHQLEGIRDYYLNVGNVMENALRAISTLNDIYDETHRLERALIEAHAKKDQLEKALIGAEEKSYRLYKELDKAHDEIDSLRTIIEQHALSGE